MALNIPEGHRGIGNTNLEYVPEPAVNIPGIRSEMLQTFCCVSLLNKLHLDLSFCYIRKPLARKLMTLLYRSLRAAEESSCIHIVDSRCTRRHLAVITHHTADVQECVH